MLKGIILFLTGIGAGCAAVEMAARGFPEWQAGIALGLSWVCTIGSLFLFVGAPYER